MVFAWKNSSFSFKNEKKIEFHLYFYLHLGQKLLVLVPVEKVFSVVPQYLQLYNWKLRLNFYFYFYFITKSKRSLSKIDCKQTKNPNQSYPANVTTGHLCIERKVNDLFKSMVICYNYWQSNI